MTKILVTGVAGFIGFHVTNDLLVRGMHIIGIDNLNTYYDVQLKLDRLKELGVDTRSPTFVQQEKTASQSFKNFEFLQLDLCDEDSLNKLFEVERFDILLNLAAQAGVRYSIKNPKAYINSNVNGFLNLLEAVRHNPVKHFIYASSSSVYGNQEKTPFMETDPVDRPVSLYAATKKSNELMAHTYHHLYNIPITGLRFFTVYGPWGRPDMAPFLFTKAILNDKPIKVFNKGDLKRDFTYIDDIVAGVCGIVEMQVTKEHQEIYNIGNNKPVRLIDFIETLEEHLNKKALKELLPMQEGDVYQTFASIEKLRKATGYSPHTNLQEGLQKFVQWYLKYYKNGKEAI